MNTLRPTIMVRDLFNTYKYKDIDKSTIVKAFQWRGEQVEGFEKICVGLDESFIPEYNLAVPTIYGIRYTVDGEYVIKGYGGYYEIRSKEHFESVYEPIST